MSHYTKKPTTCRFRKMPDGRLRIYNLATHMLYYVSPNGMREKDEDGIPIVIKEYASVLNEYDIVTLVKRCEEYMEEGDSFNLLKIDLYLNSVYGNTAVI